MKNLSNDFEGSKLTFFDETRQSNSFGDFLQSHKNINRNSITDFLLFGSILPPHSPVQGVSQLFPGETRENEHFHTAYADLSYSVQQKTEKEFVDLFEACLEEYFSKHQTVSTVLLSGGIDSATLLSFLPKGAQCITWGGKGESTDDVVYSKITAKTFGVSSHEVVLADFERDLELYKQAVRTLKVPMLFNSSVPFLRMAEIGKEKGISEWLVGQNADTLFMAYPAPILTKQLVLINKILPINPLFFLTTRKKHVFSTSRTIKLLAYFKSLGVYPGNWISVSKEYFSEKEDIIRSIPVENKEQELIVTEELLTESRRNQLCQNEIPAMYGIKALCPYYSRPFVELALSVPPHLRKKKGYSKVILKELAKRRGVPEDVIYKKKSGLSYGFKEFIEEKRHLALWDTMEKDEDLNKYIKVQQLREREQDNYLTFIMLMSLHYWFELVARPEGLKSI